MDCGERERKMRVNMQGRPIHCHTGHRSDAERMSVLLMLHKKGRTLKATLSPSGCLQLSEQLSFFDHLQFRSRKRKKEKKRTFMYNMCDSHHCVCLKTLKEQKREGGE